PKAVAPRLSAHGQVHPHFSKKGGNMQMNRSRLRRSSSRDSYILGDEFFILFYFEGTNRFDAEILKWRSQALRKVATAFDLGVSAQDDRTKDLFAGEGEGPIQLFKIGRNF